MVVFPFAPMPHLAALTGVTVMPGARILCGLMLAACSLSSAGAHPAKEPGQVELCEAMSEMAGKIMTARQRGVPMSTLATLPQSDSEEVRNLRKELLIAAFESPRYSSEDYQEKAVVDFKNGVFLECFKHVSN